ncbi:hypothetical protein ACHAO7_004900 [Fusarium culmorum]
MAPIGPLPACEGPSLAAFPYDIISDDFDFIEVLDCDARHGAIIKTKWEGRLYAIKMFISEGTPLINYDNTYSPETPDLCCQAFDWHFTPFEKECRAFGRLKEVGCEHLAVKVHGYVRVTSDEIKQKLGSERHRMRFHSMASRNARNQMMGIVKDWVEMEAYEIENLRPLYDRLHQIFHIPQMIENIHEMHKHGIVVRDLRSDQYVNGVLVDLSCSATAPHPYGPRISGEPSEYQPRWTFSSLAAWDLFSFQWQVITLWNRDYERLVKLLGRPQGMPDFCPFIAYRIPYPSTDTRKKSPRPYGPFLPILNHFRRRISVLEPARWDPLEYIQNAKSYYATKEKKRKRSEKIDQGSVEKWVSKLEISDQGIHNQKVASRQHR